MMFAALALSLALSVQDAARPSLDCSDDNGVDRCATAAQASVREKLGVATAENEASAGVEMYRAFFVDGHGFDRPAVTFERRPGSSPRVVVNGWQGRQISAALSPDTWDRVRGQSLNADRDLVPRPAPDGEEFVCFHAWVVTVEIVTPGDSDGARPVRRKTVRTCGSFLASEFAFQLAKEAINAIPPCGQLDAEPYRGDIERLAVCLSVDGDQLAAIDFLNSRKRWSPVVEADRSADDWKAWLGFSNTRRIEWSGEHIAEQPARAGIPRVSVADFLATKSRELGQMSLGGERVRGDSSAQISVSGNLWVEDRAHPSNDAGLTAPYTQTWATDINGDWCLQIWNVGAFSHADAPGERE